MTLRDWIARVELRDVLFLAGFVLVLYGGWSISRPWTMVAVGVGLILLSLFSTRRA